MIWNVTRSLEKKNRLSSFPRVPLNTLGCCQPVCVQAMQRSCCADKKPHAHPKLAPHARPSFRHQDTPVVSRTSERRPQRRILFHKEAFLGGLLVRRSTFEVAHISDIKIALNQAQKTFFAQLSSIYFYLVSGLWPESLEFCLAK